ncbi:MAG: fibronectin type III domain-containing protein [Clostridiales bacterium]|nr:fibronectin type III domain-containing protein [Clostridiales bacterium]
MKPYSILRLLGAALLVAVMASCDDDNPASTPLESTQMTASDITYSTLTFSWNKVKDALQYSYQFKKSDSDNIIETGLTKSKSVSFSGLDPDTEYTLTVLAYAQMNSSHTTSEPVVLTARTSALSPIQSPRLSWTREVNTIIVEWNQVESARDYEYTLTDSDGNVTASGTTFDTAVSFQQMATSQYTMSVVARTVKDGFCDSETSAIVIDFTREREELWRVNGNYKSDFLYTGWPAELIAYDDNSYVLLAWYGVENFNLEFSIDEEDSDNMFHLSDSYTCNQGVYTVPTGNSQLPTLQLKATANQCAMEGNSGKGSIVLAVTDGTYNGTDYFDWGVTIDDFIGDWSLDFAAYDAWGDTSYDSYDSGTVNITIGSEPNTLIVPMPKYSNTQLGYATMTVDMKNMTFTIQPVTNVYTMAGSDNETQVLTGTISPNRITFDPFQIYYDGYTYIDSTISYLIYTR